MADTFDVLKASRGEEPWGSQQVAQLKGHRRGKYRDFFRIVDAAGLQGGDIDFSKNSEDDSQGPGHLDVQKLIEERPVDEANSVSSRSTYLPNLDLQMHVLAIDVDHDAVLIPTSTEGHHHLIINKKMTWAQYEKLLDALKDAGIIQDGYHRASVMRKATWLRTPWTRKIRRHV